MVAGESCPTSCPQSFTSATPPANNAMQQFHSQMLCNTPQPRCTSLRSNEGGPPGCSGSLASLLQEPAPATSPRGQLLPVPLKKIQNAASATPPRQAAPPNWEEGGQASSHQLPSYQAKATQVCQAGDHMQCRTARIGSELLASKVNGHL